MSAVIATRLPLGVAPTTLGLYQFFPYTHTVFFDGQNYHALPVTAETSPTTPKPTLLNGQGQLDEDKLLDINLVSPEPNLSGTRDDLAVKEPEVSKAVDQQTKQSNTTAADEIANKWPAQTTAAQPPVSNAIPPASAAPVDGWSLPSKTVAPSQSGWSKPPTERADSGSAATSVVKNVPSPVQPKVVEKAKKTWVPLPALKPTNVAGIQEWQMISKMNGKRDAEIRASRLSPATESNKSSDVVVNKVASIKIDQPLEKPLAPKVEPIVEPTIQPEVQTTAEPKVEATVEPKVEGTAEPKMEAAAEPAVKPIVEPKVEAAAEPKMEAKAEKPTIEPIVEPKTYEVEQPKSEFHAPTDASEKSALKVRDMILDAETNGGSGVDQDLNNEKTDATKDQPVDGADHEPNGQTATSLDQPPAKLDTNEDMKEPVKMMDTPSSDDRPSAEQVKPTITTNNRSSQSSMWAPRDAATKTAPLSAPVSWSKDFPPIVPRGDLLLRLKLKLPEGRLAFIEFHEGDFPQDIAEQWCRVWKIPEPITEAKIITDGIRTQLEKRQPKNAEQN